MSTQRNKLIAHNTSKSEISILAKKYNYNAPGYYSYPTIIDFTEANSERNIINYITNNTDPISLYIHIPFCQSMCYYCGCNKYITRDRGKGDVYISDLESEIIIYSKYVQHRTVKSIHLGGGSPNFLTEKQLMALMHIIHKHFSVSAGAKLSFEADPRTTTHDQILLLSKCGFNRISFGVQDFNDYVQKAINREQCFDKIKALIDIANVYKFNSINIDLVYGLPLQTVDSFCFSLTKALSLNVTRITVTKYSHLPDYFPAQRKLEKYQFPDEVERSLMFMMAKNMLLDAGYKLIGMDHFVKDSDPLYTAMNDKKLIRNFIGYEISSSHDILGLGVSSISNIGGNYFQNTKDRVQYSNFVRAGEIPCVKNAIQTEERKIVWSIIHQILCYKSVDLSKVIIDGDYTKYFEKELMLLTQFQSDGLISINGGHICVTNLGDLFLRNICSVFDPRIRDSTYQTRFSSGI